MNKILLLLMFITGLTTAYADEVYWLDVRTGFEYQTGHIDGAINIPHDEIAEEIGSLIQDKNAKIHLYCRSGNRSGKALKVLQQMGYKNAINEGGYNEIKNRVVK